MTNPLADLQSALGDQYRVERELGQGGMATVYLAQDLKHERLVAIKVLNPDLSSTLGPERFLREIRLAAGLQHPHILGVYDSGEAGGQNGLPRILYYVMPFVEGESVRDRINREQQLAIEEAVQIAREVADALAHAHSHGVVHRDIKPENILLSGGHAVVADFGIARAVTEAGQDRLTKTGMAIGTPAYMSPEQASGGEGVDGRSDLYSLGCVLFEMLTGRPPFTGPNSMSIMAQHSMEVVPSLRILRPSIPEELEDVVFRALEKTPADRFATAWQMSKALSAPRGDDHGHPGRPPADDLPRRGAGRRRRGTRPMAVVCRRPSVWSSRPDYGAWRWRARAEPPESPSGPDPSHVAVLYFEDLTPGKALQHVADGFTDALIQDLGQVSALRVVSRNGVLPYRGQAVQPDSLARALDVGTLVDGTITQAGDLAAPQRLDGQRLDRGPDRQQEAGAAAGRSAGPAGRPGKRGVGVPSAASGTGGRVAGEPGRHPECPGLGTDADGEGGRRTAANQLAAAGDVALPSCGWSTRIRCWSRPAPRTGTGAAPVVMRGWLAYRRVRLRRGEPSVPALLDPAVATPMRPWRASPTSRTRWNCAAPCAISAGCSSSKPIPAAPRNFTPPRRPTCRPRCGRTPGRRRRGLP